MLPVLLRNSSDNKVNIHEEISQTARRGVANVQRANAASSQKVSVVVFVSSVANRR